MDLNSYQFYFVGIGGIGMCGLAELMHNLGAKVCGSDLSSNANTERLQSLGIHIFQQHARGQIQNADVVVYSSAVPASNPELLEAKEKGIPIIPRAEVLAEIMRLRRGIAVGGTHGKTTTTSMIASVLMAAKMDPTIVVGGRLDIIKSTAFLGKGEWLVAEADESDGSFLKLSPEIVIITNIDNDHMDFYKTPQELEANFRKFALSIPFYGRCIACGDDPNLRRALADFPKRIWWYGFAEHNDFILEGADSKYTVRHKDAEKHKELGLGKVEFSVPGRHNALNSLAALIVGIEVGLSFQQSAQALGSFKGVNRRFHYKGLYQGNASLQIPVYDDYAHHPTEIKATLQAFREKFKTEKLVLLFQPHRYSRTRDCWHDFLDCFSQADEILLLDIYKAGEAAIDGIDSASLVKAIKNKNTNLNIQHIATLNLAKDYLLNNLQKHSVFMTFGAGDVWKLSQEMSEL